MIPKFILIISTFFFVCILFQNVRAFSGNDSLNKKHSVFISSYISAILTNDLSLAVEHNYKRFRHEFGFLYKTLNGRKNYIYEKGYGVNYSIKYNFKSSKIFLVSADLGYIYRKAQYDDRIDAVAYYVNTSSTEKYGSFYRMDRKNTYSGISFGISHLTRIWKNILLGFNLYFNYGEAYQRIVAKEYIDGEVLREGGANSSEVKLPYMIENRNWQFGVTGLFKVAYQL